MDIRPIRRDELTAAADRQARCAQTIGVKEATATSVAIRQQVFGAINLALIVLATVLGVVKPRTRRASSHGRIVGEGMPIMKDAST